MKHSPALAALIEALRGLPGVGPKSAQRMAFHLLQHDRQAARSLASSLTVSLESVGRCARCRMLTEGTLCSICSNSQRDTSLLCVVESAADVVALEQSAGFRGYYFVLMGHLSPLDGVGPEQLGVREFEALLDGAAVAEVILATNPTVEGEATAHFLSELVRRRGLKASRIAHGVPVGGELEYVDGGTLAHAMAGRQALS
jgi:recombination protein RecR